MTLFKQQYRVESARLRGWDYAAGGWYFVTICTQRGRCFFGDVVDEQMHLSPIGEIVAEEWQKTERIRSDVELDQWVIMPNHLHGIIGIKDKSLRSMQGTGQQETPHRGVSTGARLRAKSLGAIINQFKSVCTKRIRAAGFQNFAWQSRFYDHVIRNEKSMNDIREYIANNPKNWQRDKKKPPNLYM
jgi:REP element-mobilizing transposase RayT